MIPVSSRRHHDVRNRHRRWRHLYRSRRGGCGGAGDAGEIGLYAGRPVRRRDGGAGASGWSPRDHGPGDARPHAARRPRHHGGDQCAAGTQGGKGRAADHRGASRHHRDARGVEGRPLQFAHGAAGATGATAPAAGRARAHPAGWADRDSARPGFAECRDRHAGGRGGGGRCDLHPACLARRAA